MATEVGVRELKNKLSEHLRRVKAGEDVIITEHGKPIAKLSRLQARPAWMEGMIARGELIPGDGRPLKGARIKLRGKGPLASDYVREQRG
ncbi:MAG: type II toxin-antitoxin system Phd/YefM family antitoxin [Acidobacteria bacterium]|nr:MAG: type II toxin-antitoxin system Phd/YefM family antitoxin [Acidobacteriota bacterium]